MIWQWIRRTARLGAEQQASRFAPLGDRLAEDLWPQVRGEISFMRAAEARGWLRAVAREPAWAICGTEAPRDEVERLIESTARSLQSRSLAQQWRGGESRQAA